MGIVPLLLENVQDYERLGQGDNLKITNINKYLENCQELWTIAIEGKGELKAKAAFTNRQTKILLAGGLLNYTKFGQEENHA